MPFRLLQLLCLLVITGGVKSEQQSEDKQVLIELKHFLQANNKIYPGAYDSWPESDSSPCGWRGVACDAAGRVDSLDLSGSSIFGPAFGNFSRLQALSQLDLSNNSIDGALPADDLSKCGGLVYLNLSHNLISGHLDLSGLTRLQTLDVSQNRFQGASFPVICGSLTVLNVSTNNLTCSVSELFNNCANLKYVDISSNVFTGKLPQGVPRLKQFSAAGNNLTGRIPSRVFPSGCSLESLDLTKNKLYGELPDSIGNCGDLVYLSLWGNNFSGLIPAGIGGINGLKTLVLASNRFDQKIPLELKNCTDLQLLDISNNMFDGELQEILGSFQSLRWLLLHDNMYTGGLISSGILRMPQLEWLDLSFNMLSGELPSELSDMKNIKYLTLAHNNFSGEIPHTVSQLPELQALDLSHNKLSGRIPTTIGNLTSLIWLTLAANRLSGDIPEEIGNCSSLLWLNLASNQLSGTIPSEMAGMGRDPWPAFAKNRNSSFVLTDSAECLAGKYRIPPYPPFSVVFSTMNLHNCLRVWDHIFKGQGVVPVCAKLSSPVRSPTLTGYVQLSGNMLTGEIPPEIGTMQHLSLLLLDDNKLSGRLPLEIGLLPLIVLNVSRNSVSGSIPSSIGQAACLEILDLSYNNFSGELPPSLTELSELNKFNVSYNPLLSGDVPIGGQFGTFDEWSFQGDPLISLHQANGKNVSAAGEAPFLGSGMTSKIIEPWIIFSVIIALVTGAATFSIINIQFDSLRKFIPYGCYL